MGKFSGRVQELPSSVYCYSEDRYRVLIQVTVYCPTMCFLRQGSVARVGFESKEREMMELEVEA